MWKCKKCNGEVIFVHDEVVSKKYKLKKDKKYPTPHKKSMGVLYEHDLLSDTEFFQCFECDCKTDYDGEIEDIAYWED